MPYYVLAGNKTVHGVLQRDNVTQCEPVTHASQSSLKVYRNKVVHVCMACRVSL